MDASMEPQIWRPQPYFAHTIQGARQVEQLNELGGLAIEFRKIGAGQIEIEGGQSRRLSLWRTRASEGFLTVPKMAADLLSIRFVTRGSLLRRNPNETFVAKPGRAILVDFGEMREDLASAGFESIGGTLSRAALMAGYRALEGGRSAADLRFEPVVDVASLPMRALMQTFVTLHRRMREGVAQSDLLFPLIEEIMVYQLLSAWPRYAAKAPRGPAATSRHIRVAMDYIEARLSERISLAEVAAAAGVSVRSLQTAFRRELGVPPLGYILDRRLDHVHADLSRSGGEALVKVVASRWGFVHMGDFSRRFRERFGHPPSQVRAAWDPAREGGVH